MSTPKIVDLVSPDLRRWWSDIGIYPNVPVFRLFERHVTGKPDAVAVIDGDGSTSYARLHDIALRLAAGLRGLGVRPGDVVASQLPNSAHACAVELAAAALGAIVLPFPPGRGHRDIQSLLRRSGAPVVIVPRSHGDAEIARTVAEFRRETPTLRHVVAWGGEVPGTESFERLVATPPLRSGDLPELDPNAPVRLLVSSGTESEPKMVAYSHNALIGGRGQFLARLQRDDRAMRAMFLVPLGSSFGSCCTFGVLAALGGSLVMVARFDPAAVLRSIAAHRPSHVAGVPTMFQRLAAAPAADELDLSSIEVLISGGSLIDPATVERCVSRFDCSFVNLYGSADGVNCHSMPDDVADVAKHTVGTPNPAVCAVRITGANGLPVPRGETGEVEALGPMSPLCYVAADELNERYRAPGGWARTGDLGLIDADGRLRLRGRSRELIVRGGSNISPAEVEGIVAEHPAVLSVACVPVPDADLGQRVCAVVVAEPGQVAPAVDELGAFLRARGLEPRKLPEYVLAIDQMPFTPAGKVDKRELARRAADHFGVPSAADAVAGAVSR